MPDLVNVLFALFAGVGGLSGIAALRNARTAARKADLDTLRVVVETLQAENKRLVERVKVLEEQNKTLRAENKQLRQRVRVLENVISKHDIALDNED